jgi:hypothetical protein
MIRRDYILRMIEEFIQALSRIDSLKGGRLWNEASAAVDEEFARLLGAGTTAVARLTETELLALLIKGGPTQAVREKALMATALFKEAGDLATAQDRSEEGRTFYLKGLHLLLEALARDDPSECPEFVPRVETLVAALRDSALPIESQARLMRYHEQMGDFAKAEDCLFSMLEAQPETPGLLELGISFYERLRGHSDASLEIGNLPRAEVEFALNDLRHRNRAATTAARV